MTQKPQLRALSVGHAGGSRIENGSQWNRHLFLSQSRRFPPLRAFFILMPDDGSGVGIVSDAKQRPALPDNIVCMHQTSLCVRDHKKYLRMEWGGWMTRSTGIVQISDISHNQLTSLFAVYQQTILRSPARVNLCQVNYVCRKVLRKLKRWSSHAIFTESYRILCFALLIYGSKEKK